MRQFKNIVALLLVFAFILTGCGNKTDNASSEANTKISEEEKVEILKKSNAYYENSQAMKFTSSMKMLGNSIDMDCVIDADKNMQMNMKMGEDMEMKMYIMQEDGAYVQYMSMDGESYIKTKDINDSFNQQADAMLQKGNGVQVPEYYTAVKDGKDYVFDGAPTFKELAENEEFKKSMSSSNQELLKNLDFSQFEGTLPIHLVISGEDYHIKELTINMTEMMKAMFGAMLEQSSEEVSSEALDLEFNMVIRDVVNTDVPKVELPEAAKNAQDFGSLDSMTMPGTMNQESVVEESSGN